MSPDIFKTSSLILFQYFSFRKFILHLYCFSSLQRYKIVSELPNANV